MLSSLVARGSPIASGIFSVSRDVEVFSTRLGICDLDVSPLFVVFLSVTFSDAIVQLFFVVSVFSNTLFFVLSVTFSDARELFLIMLFLIITRLRYSSLVII